MVIFCSETILKGLNLMASKTTTFKKNKKNDRKLGVFIGSLLILLVVVISFILAPALGDMAQGDMGDIEFGSYGKEKITFSRLRDTPFQREIAQMTRSSQSGMADYRTVKAAYNSTVTKAAAIDAFNSSGYKITKKQIDDEVLKSAVYNENGSFSTVLFKNTSEGRKQEIRNEIERGLKIRTWMDNTMIQQKRSKGYMDFISSLSNNKRNFKYATLNFSDYPKELIAEFVDQNSALFTSYDLSRLTVKSKSLAEKIVSEIESGEATFEEQVESYSIDYTKQSGGKVPTVTFEFDLDITFGKDNIELFKSMKLGDAPIIVENNDNYILFKLNSDIIEKPDMNDNEITKRVRDYMLNYERGTIEDYFMDKVNNIDGNLLGLGVEIKETGLFSINYGGDSLINTSINRVNSDSIFTRAVSNENFFEKLFKLEENAISEAIVLGDTISVFQLIDEVNETNETNEYTKYIVNSRLADYKSRVYEDLVLTSKKFIDNFNTAYNRINSGN